MSELWDAYDKNLNLIKNTVLVRGESIESDIYHLVCDIVVQHKDGMYLLMQRDLKKHLGGMWELSAGGSALKGENSVEAAIRELHEETGILSNKLYEIGREIHKERHSYYVEYLCVTDCEKNSILLQNGETIDYKWVDKETLLENTNNLASTRILKFIPGLM